MLRERGGCDAISKFTPGKADSRVQKGSSREGLINKRRKCGDIFWLWEPASLDDDDDDDDDVKTQGANVSRKRSTSGVLPNTSARTSLTSST